MQLEQLRRETQESLARIRHYMSELRTAREVIGTPSRAPSGLKNSDAEEAGA
jgi:hypothetical protein